MNPIFLRLFDDAAIFPPGDLPIPDAVKAYRERQLSPLEPLLGPFVCSLARLDELIAAAAAGGRPLPVSLVLPGPDLAAVPAASTAIDVVAIEAPGLIGRGGTRSAYREVAWAEITATRVAALRDAGLRLKIRTGGVRAEAFPTEKDLAEALCRATEGGVPFKLTAGLHDPIRHRDPLTGFEHHGFLNVLVATAHAVQGGGAGEIAAALADQDGHRVAAAITTIDDGLAREVRRQFVSFGTCSISEPVDGLLQLGLLPEGIL
ncbi:hypothetical protein AB0F72_20405 [Actinoplanes sp. NPDC023936]|uniref:hypothetical protein n=1 Tax=Actinoplanes sp. NPDC023936 TaxID=3154910 RepID=UPI0033F0810D